MSNSWTSKFFRRALNHVVLFTGTQVLFLPLNKNYTGRMLIWTIIEQNAVRSVVFPATGALQYNHSSPGGPFTMNKKSIASVADSSVSTALASKIFDELAVATGDGVGITRSSYGPGETRAIEIVDLRARELGLRTERDEVANLIVTLDGSEPELPFVAAGSHLDSVPQGGNFDGSAGVLAVLVSLAALKAEGVKPRRTIKLFALRGEESARFGKPYLGSSALFGRISPVDLQSRSTDTAETLAECMGQLGIDVDRVARGERFLDPARIAAWFELHIEQGPVLTDRNLPVGIVTGIRGNIRHRGIQCRGEAGHSGAVPRWLRRDAVFASAELITHLDRHWRTLLERGRDLVVTSGMFGTDQREHALARIPGNVQFSFEARSQSKETLESFYDLFLSECQMIGEERGVEFILDRRFDTQPASMDPDWIKRLRSIAARLGIQTEDLPSGAGHDAAVFANEGVPSAMIFVRNANGSHNPHEAMSLNDFGAGAALMRAAIEEAAQ